MQNGLEKGSFSADDIEKMDNDIFLMRLDQQSFSDPAIPCPDDKLRTQTSDQLTQFWNDWNDAVPQPDTKKYTQIALNDLYNPQTKEGLLPSMSKMIDEVLHTPIPPSHS
jgi:hypothetical protein